MAATLQLLFDCFVDRYYFLILLRSELKQRCDLVAISGDQRACNVLTIDLPPSRCDRQGEVEIVHYLDEVLKHLHQSAAAGDCRVAID